MMGMLQDWKPVIVGVALLVAFVFAVRAFPSIKVRVRSISGGVVVGGNVHGDINIGKPDDKHAKRGPDETPPVKGLDLINVSLAAGSFIVGVLALVL